MAVSHCMLFLAPCLYAVEKACMLHTSLNADKPIVVKNSFLKTASSLTLTTYLFFALQPWQKHVPVKPS
jgi:hypothetical protein